VRRWAKARENGKQKTQMSRELLICLLLTLPIIAAMTLAFSTSEPAGRSGRIGPGCGRGGADFQLDSVGWRIALVSARRMDLRGEPRPLNRVYSRPYGLNDLSPHFAAVEIRMRTGGKEFRRKLLTKRPS